MRATGAGNSLSAWSNVASARTQALTYVPSVRVVQKPGYHPAVLEWPTLEDPTIIGYEYERSDYKGDWIPLTDRYGGTGGGNEYIQPDHLTAYCVCADPNEPPYVDAWLSYDDWVGSGTTFRVRILREEAPGQNQQPNEPGSVEPPPSQNSPGGSGPVGVAIPADSPIIPEGLGPGDSFRLLFVTSATTTRGVCRHRRLQRVRAGAGGGQ